MKEIEELIVTQRGPSWFTLDAHAGSSVLSRDRLNRTKIMTAKTRHTSVLAPPGQDTFSHNLPPAALFLDLYITLTNIWGT